MSDRPPSGGSNLAARLGRWLGRPPLAAEAGADGDHAPAQLSAELGANWAASLAPLQAEVGRLAQANAELQASHAQSQAQWATVSETLDRLEKQTTRAGKEQFKANTLAEAQQQNVKAMLEQIRTAEAGRERELAQWREALPAARAQARQEILRQLLPIADGLSEALAAGERLLARPAEPRAPEAVDAAPFAHAVPLPWLTRLLGAWDLLTGPATPGQPPLTAPDTNREALRTWLHGLTLVEARVLDLLAAEDIHPIATEGQRFDPHQHVAIDTVPAGAGVTPGFIVQETRRGYARGETVLRYAEVIVAK